MRHVAQLSEEIEINEIQERIQQKSIDDEVTTIMQYNNQIERE